MLKLLEDMKHFYVVTGRTDMRKQIDGLAAVIQITFKEDLAEGSLFLFCGGKKDRFKALFWDGTGYVLMYKRLVESKFQWPRNQQELKQISPQQFRWLMEGLSIYQDRSIKTSDRKDLF